MKEIRKKRKEGRRKEGTKEGREEGRENNALSFHYNYRIHNQTT